MVNKAINNTGTSLGMSKNVVIPNNMKVAPIIRWAGRLISAFTMVYTVNTMLSVYALFSRKANTTGCMCIRINFSRAFGLF